MKASMIPKMSEVIQKQRNSSLNIQKRSFKSVLTKGCSEICGKFTGEHLCWSVILKSTSHKAISKTCTASKVSKYGDFSGPYFPVFNLNRNQKKFCIWTLFTQCWTLYLDPDKPGPKKKIGPWKTWILQDME